MKFVTPHRRGALPWFASALLIVSSAVFGQAQRPPPAAVTGAGQALRPSCPAPNANNDYSGKTLVLCNFNKAGLANAKFTNATLTAVAFDGADLTNADFSGATFGDSGDPTLPTDFSYATLRNAKFVGAVFKGLTYLTHADVSCANFSNADISTTTAVFGPSPLKFDAKASCGRPVFASATMSCEFVGDWPQLDLTGAKGLKVCGANGELASHDFSGAMLDGTDLTSIDLSHTKWTGASLQHTDFSDATLDYATGLNAASKSTVSPYDTKLRGTVFAHASAKFVDFSNARLNGANFQYAELTGANFSGASLINDNTGSDPILEAAQFDYAHLKNVNLSGATLNSVTFTYASLYGTMALEVDSASTCQTDVKQCTTDSPATGGTCSCATLSGANLTRADFTSAFLYGVDFSEGTVINGTVFEGAMLVGANFDQATFEPDPSQGGAPPRLAGSWLQGANLSTANLSGVSLGKAHLDFGYVDPTTGSTRPSGRLALQLTENHAAFRDWTGSAKPCLHIGWASPSALPSTGSSTTCPDTNQYPDGCGSATAGQGAPSAPASPPPAPANPRWYGGLVASAVPITGWYRDPGTYEAKAKLTDQCSGNAPETNW